MKRQNIFPPILTTRIQIHSDRAEGEAPHRSRGFIKYLLNSRRELLVKVHADAPSPFSESSGKICISTVADKP